ITRASEPVAGYCRTLRDFVSGSDGRGPRGCSDSTRFHTEHCVPLLTSALAQASRVLRKSAEDLVFRLIMCDHG
ncbi:Hypothetical predicted protein, partial [Marmota monax]